MLHGRDWRISIWVVAHSGLLALGCGGITERRVQERDDIGETAGTATERAGSSAGGAGGADGVSRAGASAGGANGVGSGGKSTDVTHGSGRELEPVGVGGMPPDSCTCGSGCLIEQCAATTLVEPFDFLMNVVVRGGQLYWMSEQNLGRMGVQGGGGVSLAAELRTPSRVVVDTGFAYFSSYQGLWKVRRDATGGAMLVGTGSAGAQLLATLTPWQRRLTEIAVDSLDIYWTAPATLQVPACLNRTPVAGGRSVTLARLPDDGDWPLGLAVDDSDAYFTSNGGLYWVSKAGDSDMSFLEPIEAEVSYEAPHPTLGIALDQRFVYFDGGRTLRRRAKGGINSVSLFNVPQGDELRGIVLDLDYAYFGTKSGNIMRVPKLGGDPSVMVSGEQNPLVTAVDATSVYWVEQEAGRIRKASK